MGHEGFKQLTPDGGSPEKPGKSRKLIGGGVDRALENMLVGKADLDAGALARADELLRRFHEDKELNLGLEGVEARAQALVAAEKGQVGGSSRESAVDSQAAEGQEEIPIAPELAVGKMLSFIADQGLVIRGAVGVYRLYQPSQEYNATRRQKFRAFVRGTLDEDDPRKSRQIAQLVFGGVDPRSYSLKVYGRENFQRMSELARKGEEEFGLKVKIVLASEHPYLGPILGESERQDRY